MRDEGSFKDPSGFIFYHEGRLYRAINDPYKENYDFLIQSGLYDRLLILGLLIPHKIVEENLELPYDGIYKIIEPERISFVSYPYEWSFSQLKDAALLTLKIQKIAMEYGMSLKDASAYNVQFHKGQAVFIDTLSFEVYVENKPWKAYRQFCQHFLAPLALMSKRDIRLLGLLKNYMDGIPLDLCSKLLPNRTYFSLGLLLHLHLHASAQTRHQSNKVEIAELKRNFSRNSFSAVLNSLESAVRRIKWRTKKTEWRDYYEEVHEADYIETKKETLIKYLQIVGPKIVWDFGANEGYFSRLAAEMGAEVGAFDIDPACVENNYKKVIKQKETRVLPLLLDLTNPSPSLGWANRERKNIEERGEPDLVMALALIHHLVIVNNLPLDKVAEYLSNIAAWLVIEFVPKEDEQVKQLLRNRKDIFSSYHQAGFEAAFLKEFGIVAFNTNPSNGRILYLMKKR